MIIKMFRKMFALRSTVRNLPIYNTNGREYVKFVSSVATNKEFPMLPTSRNRFYCSTGAGKISIVYYNEIKGLPAKSNVMLIDVREPNEIQKTGQIPTSINIPLGSVMEELGSGIVSKRFKEKYGRDKPHQSTQLIFYCRLGRRGLEAAQGAMSLGYHNVKVYEGSWTEWAEKEGLPNEK